MTTLNEKTLRKQLLKSEQVKTAQMEIPVMRIRGNQKLVQITRTLNHRAGKGWQRARGGDEESLKNQVV